MKSFFVLAAASLAVVNAATCDIAKLSPLLADPDVKQCGSETGLSPPKPASPEVLPKLCGNKACLSALAKLKALGAGDCTIGTISLETDFINPIEAYCAKATPASTPAPAVSSPSPTTAAPGATPAPATTTKAPTNSTTPAPAKTTATPTTSSGSKTGSDSTIEDGSVKAILSPSDSSSSSSIDTTIKTPSKTTPAPTPAKSGASSLAFAASAVVLAVAASFM